jgi:hypothetical protein
MTIVNDNSRAVNKLEALLTDNARVIIYNRQTFIVQAIVQNIGMSNVTANRTARFKKM